MSLYQHIYHFITQHTSSHLPGNIVTPEVCDATGDATLYCCPVHKKTLAFIVSLFIITVLNAQQKFALHFHNVAGNKQLNIDSLYTNHFGETLQVRNFKYYISNITLTDVTGKKEVFTDQYFLIAENDSTSKSVVLSTRLSNISSVEFLLGVDSIKNTTGVQTGALDPAKGMFWTWNSGYVMAKLEGRSAAAKTPAHAFSFHVGGYRQNEDATKKIMLQATSKNMNAIDIYADILKWFYGANDIKLAEQAFCHEPGMLAMQLADNYANMFTTTMPQ